MRSVLQIFELPQFQQRWSECPLLQGKDRHGSLNSPESLFYHKIYLRMTYCQKNEKLYQLVENETEDEWELLVSKIQIFDLFSLMILLKY